jgi:hypothetical protein
VSGSTIVRRGGERFAIQLETPCVSFAVGPDGRSPEQDFHQRARLEFEAVLDAIGPGLADALERAAAAAGVTTAPLVAGGCACRVWTSSSADGKTRGLPSFGFIEVGLAAPIEDAARARLQAAVLPELEALLPPKPPPKPPPEPPREPEPPPAPRSWLGRLRRVFGR